jgi:hypothetical protein
LPQRTLKLLGIPFLLSIRTAFPSKVGARRNTSQAPRRLLGSHGDLLAVFEAIAVMVESAVDLVALVAASKGKWQLAHFGLPGSWSAVSPT